jgi:hypothetical protein
MDRECREIIFETTALIPLPRMGLEYRKYGGDYNGRKKKKDKGRIKKNEEKRLQSSDDSSSQSSETDGCAICSEDTISFGVTPSNEDKRAKVSRSSRLWLERKNSSESLDHGRAKALVRANKGKHISEFNENPSSTSFASDGCS